MRVVGTVSYTKLQQIGVGEGRNSQVFLIKDEQMDADLVAKEIDKTRFPDPSSYFEEAKVLYTSQHRHILRVQYAGESNDRVFLVMPRAKGGSLQSKIKHRSLTLSRSVEVMLQLLAAVGHIHSKSLLHLDIKPSNVLLDEHDRVLLADFGQSARLDANGVAAQLPGIYPPFLPPETLSTATAVPASDVYQCAFTLLRCIWGDWFLPPPPKSQIAQMLLETEIAVGKFPPRGMPAHVPDRLQRAILRGLAPDPAKRFQTAAEFGEELARVRFKLDWQLAYHPDRLEWTARRPDHPDLTIIRRGPRHASNFDVEAYVGTGSKRRGHKKDLWATALSEIQCERRLKKLFKALP